MGEESNLYASERNDLLYSILSQVQSKFDINSRGYHIIKSLLDANPRVGECTKIMSEVRNVFSGDGKLTHDQRYMFTVSKTPGDHREGKNIISDIDKIIDIERKI